jgi:hypothetical protein
MASINLGFIAHEKGTLPGYGMFNVWLPTVLEERAKGNGAEGLSEALKEFVACVPLAS